MTMTRGEALRLAVPGLILAAVLAFLAKALSEALSEGLASLPKLPASLFAKAAAVFAKLNDMHYIISGQNIAGHRRFG